APPEFPAPPDEPGRPRPPRTVSPPAPFPPPPTSKAPGPEPSEPRKPVSFEPPEPEKRRRSDELRSGAEAGLRAVGSWAREKGPGAGRGLKRGIVAVGAWWSRSSRGTRVRLFAAVALVVLYLVVKFASIPAVPCEISAAKECAPSDDTIAYVPRDAAL